MKIRIFKKKIIIGTAQLLSNYGASNFVPLKNKKKEAIKLLNFCEKNNLNKFDTASGYKNERFIGNFFHNYSNKNFTPSFITKISSLEKIEDRKKISEIERSIDSSFKSLKFKIDTILFHDQKDIGFVEKNIDKIQKVFEKFNIREFGYSLYDIKFFNKIKNSDHNLTIQVPTNIINDFFLKKKFKKNFKIIGRSVFMQGILLNQKIKKGFRNDLYKSHKKYLEYLKKYSLDPTELSTSIISNKNINSFIFGVEKFDQISSILNTKINFKNNQIHLKKIKKIFKSKNIYDPRKWKFKK